MVATHIWFRRIRSPALAPCCDCVFGRLQWPDDVPAAAGIAAGIAGVAVIVAAGRPGLPADN